MASLVLHINREFIHHLSEVCLLRDLYLHTDIASRERRPAADANGAGARTAD